MCFNKGRSFEYRTTGISYILSSLQHQLYCCAFSTVTDSSLRLSTMRASRWKALRHDFQIQVCRLRQRSDQVCDHSMAAAAAAAAAAVNPPPPPPPPRQPEAMVLEHVHTYCIDFIRNPDTRETETASWGVTNPDTLHCHCVLRGPDHRHLAKRTPRILQRHPRLGPDSHRAAAQHPSPLHDAVHRKRGGESAQPR